jgi:hypothetical protein
MTKTLYITLFASSIALFSCTKDDDCIDKSKVVENPICTQNYDPVCGCNNITYGNSCEANAAGVKSFTQGACK